MDSRADSGRRGRLRHLAPAAAALAVAVLASACGGAGTDDTVTADAPVVTVVTGLWPLAQAVADIGQGNVRVVDVVPAGDDPQSYALRPSAARTVRGAALVVQVAGFQPSLAAAASGARHVLSIDPQGGNPYVWLNPYSMEGVSRRVARALDGVDPKASRTIANGLDDFEAVLQSLDEDYESTLGTCPEQTLVTVDEAFGVLAPRYPVRVVPVDGATPAPLEPTATTLAREVATTRRAGVGTVYDETWYPESGLIPLQERTGVKIASLDTLEGIPPGGFPKGVKTYYEAMETDLGAISAALHCPNPNEEGD